MAEKGKDLKLHLLPIFIVFTILPLIAVTLRVMARRIKQMNMWWDDYLILVACAFLLAHLAFITQALTHGLGKHVVAVSPKDLEQYLLYTYMSELYYATDITLVKCSILCLYLRIFGVDRKFRMICYGMMAFVVAWGVAVILVTIFQCKPVEAGWDKTIAGKQCFNLGHFVIGSNVPNIIADAAIIALPIPRIWELQLSLGRKVGLVAIFLLAALTTIISILRVTFNAHVDITDPTWNLVLLAVLSTVEVNFGICCACMPVVYPLLRILVRHKNNSSTDPSTPISEAGYQRKPSRSRHQFSHLDEGSSTNHLWNSKLQSGNTNSDSGCGGGYDDIPMGRIKVTQYLRVERTETE